MTINEGGLDRVVRVVVGLAIIALVFVGPKTPWAWLGLVPLLTGIVGFCPAYALSASARVSCAEALQRKARPDLEDRGGLVMCEAAQAISVTGIRKRTTPSLSGGGKRPPRMFTCRDGKRRRGAASVASRARRASTKWASSTPSLI